MNSTVIFGGTGFIGVFFAQYLLEAGRADKVYLVDIEPVETKFSEFRNKQVAQDSCIVFVKGDVRQSLDWFSPAEQVTLIANFAAIHREPGHEDFEYYQTNLLGAENVSAWAAKVGCNSIIFTSSISPYGPSEAEKDERSLPSPVTAYGGSKLAAEKIHQIWQALDNERRRLVIVRPGVVFGPGEGGNGQMKPSDIKWLPIKKRGRYTNDFKRQLIEACAAPGVSTASIALANGINANLLWRWVAERTRPANTH